MTLRSLQTRTEKSFSYLISYSNLKSPINIMILFLVPMIFEKDTTLHVFLSRQALKLREKNGHASQIIQGLCEAHCHRICVLKTSLSRHVDAVSVDILADTLSDCVPVAGHHLIQAGRSSDAAIIG